MSGALSVDQMQKSTSVNDEKAWAGRSTEGYLQIDLDASRLDGKTMSVHFPD